MLPVGTKAGNVTYTISGLPPTSNVRVVQLPVAEDNRALPASQYTSDSSRNQYGDLVYTLVSGAPSNPGSNIKAFEIGEVLEFEDDFDFSELEPVNAPDKIEIRHNTNILDLKAAGLSDDDIDSLVQDSSHKKSELEQQFSELKSELDDVNIAIAENQKKLNENKKTLRATRVIYGIPENDLNFANDIYQKLLVSKAELEVQRGLIIAERNTKALEIESVYHDLLRVSELVK